jgi:hypothetical protein
MTPEESIPSMIKTPPGHFLTVWVIFDHPDDAPHAFVLRPQFVCHRDPGNINFGIRTEEPSKWTEIIVSRLAWYSDDSDKLRSILPPGLVRMPRNILDPPELMETWL